MEMTIDEALEKLRDPTVTKLDLKSCDFGEAEVKRIAEALPHSQITWLSFYGNNIGDAGAATLAGALPHSQVTWLNLYRNNIGAAGATAIADALPYSQVTSLNLAMNNIGAAGAAALATVLPLSQIAWLDLFSNNVSDAGASALAGVLPHSQVTSLDLGLNSIGDAERVICTRKIQENAALERALAQKLVEKTKLEQPDRIALQRLAHAVASYLSKEHKLDETAIKSLLLGAAEQFLADGAPQTKAFALRVLPLPEAREWLKEKDIEVTLADFLTPEGVIPQGRFLCQGGVRALFLEENLWETAAQANKALRHLPPEQKAFIPNAHTLLANLSKRVVVPAGPEVG